MYKQIFNTLPSTLATPSLFPLCLRGVPFQCVLQLYSIYSKSNGFFFALSLSLSLAFSLYSFSILFYFILFDCLRVYWCVCVQSLKAISMVVAFLANFLYAVVGVSFGAAAAAARSLNVFITPNEWKLPQLAEGTTVHSLPLSLHDFLSVSLLRHKIISLVKIFHSNLLGRPSEQLPPYLSFSFGFSCNFNNIARA